MLLLEKLTQEAIELLEKLFSSIPQIEKERILKRLQSTVIISSESTSNFHGNYILLDPPMLIESKIYERPIRLYMSNPERKRLFFSKLFHELMHISSISDLILVDSNTYMYNWGICSTQYTFVQDAVSSKVFRENNFLNELLTDLAAEYCFSTTIGQKFWSETFINPLIQLCGFSSIKQLADLTIAYMNVDAGKLKHLLFAQTNLSTFNEIEQACKQIKYSRKN